VTEVLSPADVMSPAEALSAAEALSPAEAFARPRPDLRWLDATTILEQFALVTFDVDPVALATALPPGLEPEVRTLDDGRVRGFVSAVSFRDVDFRFAVAPWLRVSFFQTNYRAYVRGPDGRQAVHFFGTTLDSPLVGMPRYLWGMPWHPGRSSIESSWTDAGVCDAYRHRCAGRWGSADVSLMGRRSRSVGWTALPTPRTRPTSSRTHSTAGSRARTAASGGTACGTRGCRYKSARQAWRGTPSSRRSAWSRLGLNRIPCC
jgi:uncharacterized protein YqjF (DUF2071 family)